MDSESQRPTTLTVGYVPGVILTKWRNAWAQRFPRISLETVPVAEAGQLTALSSGAVDLCFVRAMPKTEGFHLIPLYDEQVVAWVAKDHPVAAYDSVTSADLVGETLLDQADTAAIDRVVAGAAVLLVPLSIARLGHRKDLVHRVVDDAEPVPIGLAWPQTADSGLIEEFIGIVRGRTPNSSRSAKERQNRATKTAPSPARKAKPAPRGTRARQRRSGR